MFRALVSSKISWRGPWSYESQTDFRGGSRGAPTSDFGGLQPHGAMVAVTFTQVTLFQDTSKASFNYSLTPWGLGNRPTGV